jgi:hypothetical protein
MRFFLTLALVATSCVLTGAQDFNHYKTLLPQGLVPRDFTERSADKFATAVTDIQNDKESRRREKKSQKKFYLESTFGVDEFLASGNVLFNDEVSLYTASVLEEILKPYPELQNKIRVYAVKSAVPNAFTTNNGIIFVNLGLLARLDNEAQLAFILAHEVVHYQKKHAINKYVNNVEIERSKGNYRKLSTDGKEFAKSTYSKELESEADLGGADIYLKTSYTKDSVHKVFDILKLADFPLSWMTFDQHRFESGSYVFPDTLIAKTVKEVYAEEDYDDSKSSHPNIKKRKEAITGKFGNGGNGDAFKISRSWFEKVRKTARFELCRTYLIDHRYLDALTLSLSLQQADPASSYLKETVAKALYGLGKDRLTLDSRHVEESWAGEPARLATFFNRQSGYEISVMAIRHLYKCLEETPDNVEISLMLNDMLYTLAEAESDLTKYFARKASDKEIAELKYPYTQFAFLDFKDSDAFFKVFDKQVARSKKDDTIKTTRKKKKKARSKLLKVDKVVVVNPMYRKVDTRKKQKVRHIESEEVLVNMDEKIRGVADKLDMKVDIINPNNLSSSKVSVLQSSSILNDWIDEQLRSEYDARVSPIYNEVVALADSYKTDHFVWMGELTLTYRSHGRALLVGGSLIIPAMAPLFATMFVAPRGATLYFGLVFNVRTQAAELVDIRQMSSRDTALLLQSNMYYTLLKLKKVRL